MLRPKDWIASNHVDSARYPNLVAVSMLVKLLVVVAVLTILCVLVPLLLTAKRPPLREHGPLLLYFAGIGLGFMFVEVALLQRLTVFLGHPTYALTTILFSLLIAGGLGSMASGKLQSRFAPLLGLVGTVIAVGVAVEPAMKSFEASSATVRIAVAALLVGAVGFFMGMALPTGMRIANQTAPRLIPWLWGVNGATSVFASVLAAAVALAYGISVSYWVGLCCYGASIAAMAMVRVSSPWPVNEPHRAVSATSAPCLAGQER
jgi:hypothetical protein